MKALGIYMLLLVPLFFIFACGESTSTSPSTPKQVDDATKGQSAVIDEESQTNILQIAINSKDHSTLVAAVQAAGLEDVLVNAGPLTVFAPSNEAFDKLPEGTVEELLKPENKDKLATIIKYHASPGKYLGDLFQDGMNLFQATGHYVKVEKNGEQIIVAGANVLATVEASNGVVHVIDKVLLPPNE